jgi:predicted Rossmann fold flavoprotein
MREYDIIIIGAGPAGLIGTIEAYREGVSICILEKMPIPAIKLRLSGKGRCNITNSTDLKDFISHFGKNGNFLKYSFLEFFNNELLEYFKALGIKFKLERGGRYFLNSNKAEEIANVLVNKVNNMNIQIHTEHSVEEIIKKNDIFTLITKNKKFSCKKLLIATGGKSYPKTGSNGDGFELAKKTGHKIIPPLPALVPLKTDDKIVKQVADLTLKNVNVSLWAIKEKTEKKITEQFGEMEFKSYGLAGPIILTISKEAVKLLDKNYKVFVRIDLKPAIDHKKLDARILREISQNPKKDFKYLLEKLLPIRMIPVFINKLKIHKDNTLNQLTSPERKMLRLLLKEFEFKITDFFSYNNAIITSGGISIGEINKKTMESKIVKNLFFAGEIIDIDADTGGFNLQAAFSTGYIAGRSMKEQKLN